MWEIRLRLCKHLPAAGYELSQQWRLTDAHRHTGSLHGPEWPDPGVSGIPFFFFFWTTKLLKMHWRYWSQFCMLAMYVLSVCSWGLMLPKAKVGHGYLLHVLPIFYTLCLRCKIFFWIIAYHKHSNSKHSIWKKLCGQRGGNGAWAGRVRNVG